MYDFGFDLKQKLEKNCDEVADPEYLSWAPAIDFQVMRVETVMIVRCVEGQHVHRKDYDSVEVDNEYLFCDGVKWYQTIVSDLVMNDESKRSPLGNETGNGTGTVNEVVAA